MSLFDIYAHLQRLWNWLAKKWAEAHGVDTSDWED